MPGGGCKPHAEDMEEVLAAWIEQQRGRHLRVTRTAIQRNAVELYDGNGEFTASRGWLEKFLKRNSFSLRRKTTVSQRLPQDQIPNVSLLLHSSCEEDENEYGNMDETPLWLDMPVDIIVSRIGERSVSVCTTGHDKGCFTIILAAMEDGRKLKPFVVFKGVRPISALSKISWVVVNYSRNGWMNEELTVKWVDLKCIIYDSL